VITKLSASSFKAQYKGVGTINGVAGYGFIVTVTDGGQIDTARIRVWNIATGVTVYDNEFDPRVPGNPTTITTNPTTVTAGGNIVVHDK
jgi:hypothetical protein